MNKRVILTVVFSAIGIIVIAFLLTLGNNVSVPTPVTLGTNPPASGFPKGASNTNYTILCVKKSDGKIKFTKTGPYVTCPSDYATVPVQLDPKLIKK